MSRPNPVGEIVGSIFGPGHPFTDLFQGRANVEANESTCTKCRHKWRWVGYKTGIGKTPAQLAEMAVEGRTCPRCGGLATISPDPQDDSYRFAASLFGVPAPVSPAKETPTMAKAETDNYIVITTGDVIRIEQMDKATLLNRLNENYPFGGRDQRMALPTDRDAMCWGSSGFVIIKGHVVIPQARQTVVQYDID